MKNSYPFTDKELELAAKEVIWAIAESVPPAGEFRHEFSPAARARMTALTSRVQHRERKRTVFRSVAAVFILLLATVTVWLSADAEARETVLRWVRETFEFGVVYKLESTVEPAATLPKYEITWLPEGLEMVEEGYQNNTYNVTYYNKDTDKTLIFDYEIEKDGDNAFVLTDQSTQYSTITINGVDAEYYQDDNSRTIMWIDEKDSLLFVITSDLDKETVIRFAEGIRKK